MPFKFERLYGVATTVDFTLLETDGVDFRVDAVHASGDTTIMKDEGTEANTSNGFTDEGIGYSLALTSTEMSAARIVIYIIDQTATKVWLDDYIIIETYGNENSQHPRREPGVIIATTIASVTNNSNFVITDKPNDNNVLLNSVAFIVDNSTPDTPADRSFRNVTSYTGASGAVVLESDTDFTIAAGDLVFFFATADVESASAIADAVHDEIFEGTTTLRQFLRLAASVLYGKASGLNTTNALYRDEADSKNRIDATVDSSGNRTAVTLDKT